MTETTSTKIAVSEGKRTVISVTGEKVILHDVTAFDASGTWLRLWAEEGYVLVNPDNVLAMICEGESVR